MLLAALMLMLSAIALAAFETFAHFRRVPANDHDIPHLSPRYIARMRIAAVMLAVALALIIASYFM